MFNKVMMINFSIIVLNVIFGMILNIWVYSSLTPVRERYVLLPEDGVLINNSQSLENRPLASDKGCASENENNLTLDPTRGLLDQSRNYLTHPFAVSGERWKTFTSSWQICMSTQTSADLLFWISKQAEMWHGPISVSVFTPDVDYTVAIKMINYLQTCFPVVRHRVSFHFTYPRKMPPIYVHQVNANKEYDCEQPESVNKALVYKFRTNSFGEILKRSAYPQNLLRNIARKGCPNDYTFTPDIDMISIPGISEELNKFVSRETTRACAKCAYVIPTYEIQDTVKANPVDKNDLKDLQKHRKARRFHARAFAPNQGNSQLPKWESKGLSEELEVMYNITTWKNYWEPIYIAKANVPFYDERFVGYGYTRNSQVYEMHVAGYTWHMLSNAFLCHRGFQLNKSRDKIRKTQIEKNAGRFKLFRKEIYARYNKTESDFEVKRKGVNHNPLINPVDESDQYRKYFTKLPPKIRVPMGKRIS